MKTIFITSFNPFVSRNILSTDALGNLIENKDLRIVIFCPDYKKDFFKSLFSFDNVVIEGIKLFSPGWQDKVFNYFGRSIVNTSTLAIHRKEIFLRNRKLFLFVFSILLSIFGKLSLVKKFFRFIDLISIEKGKYKTYFDSYRPDIVFSTDVYNIGDAHFLADAKNLGISTVGMVRSWDNITNKGLFRIKPDKLIVNNNVTKEEVLAYEDMLARDIFVSGMPQFDFYINNKIPRTDRETFFWKIGLDPTKQTILIAPHGKRFFDKDVEILEMLKSLPYQYIVRLPPNDIIDLPNFNSNKNFFIDHPGFSFKENTYRDREITVEDTLRLADELYYCDVILNYVSSLVIDASFFDKPIINISFDGHKDCEYIKSERRFLNFTHLKKMFDTGCCKTVFSLHDLERYIESYLNNPSLDSENRKIFLIKQAWKLDGRSGHRISNFLLERLGIK